MRVCNWYRVVVVCLLSGVVLGLLNVVLWSPQAEPYTCDCSVALSRRESELKVQYEHEIQLRNDKIAEFKSRAAAQEPSAVSQDSNVPAGARGGGESPARHLEEDDVGKPFHRLAVLVPFRNRHEEMQEFVPHIHQFLNRQTVHHDIWVINQADTHRFNRASLLNVGFLMSRDRCDYMVMHDVDLLPQNDDLMYSYPSSGPYHISSPSLHPLYHYKTFVGGVLSLTREQFEKVNGLSNLFWGWGREDDELYIRMKEAGMKVQYPKGISTGYKTFRHIHDKVKRPRDQKRYYDQSNMSRKRDRNTGLNTLQYKVLSHLNMTINGAPFNFVNVELECNTKVTPFCDEPPK